ncbi:NUDIX hydrolase [Aquimarina algicola]|uniref:NUDIX hydrolase n=1 Tax=Aquimarina algicola TaxID=2589995 RepID=A0A504JAK9_9FLAO|nr:NUDIX hydrolase [Aquimarina algicola]TPN87986.1 NUDIX hydrolase [Aquimarina algicola]
MQHLLIKLILVNIYCSFSCCKLSAQEAEKPLDNYTIKRLIVYNDKDQIAMVNYREVWDIPPLRYNTSETYNESLVSLAKAMGIEISKPKLAGIFSFKYGYTNRAALRMFYTARLKKGTLKPKDGWNKVRWMPKNEVLALKDQDVYSYIGTKVIEDTTTLWGGAFYLYKEKDQVKYKITEEFYPLR